MGLPDSRRPFCAHHYRDAAQLAESNGASTWITRGARLCVAVTAVRTGTVLVRIDQPDEHMLILPETVSAHIEAQGSTTDAPGDSLVILPPGASRITLQGSGVVARLLTDRATDLCAVAINAAQFPNGFVTDARPVEPWPEPPGGYRTRVYPLARHVDPQGPRIQPRIFRSTNIMVNIFAPWHDRRPPESLSPHWHHDFEQISLGLTGQYLHHIRMPWGSDARLWQPDLHVEAASPSVQVIPPKAIHTTQNVGDEMAQLVDVFAPPRADFSARPGMVLNAADYPAPDWVQQTMNDGTMAGWAKR